VILAANFAIALRGEYYEDEKGVIIPTSTTNGFNTFGTSLNVDYSPTNNLLLRIEGRYLNSKDKIFAKDALLKNNNSALTFSASIGF
jgi:Putative beta-barrel porin-2, OmpL-like. bbp2